jgi:hypothetical protein
MQVLADPRLKLDAETIDFIRGEIGECDVPPPPLVALSHQWSIAAAVIDDGVRPQHIEVRAATAEEVVRHLAEDDDGESGLLAFPDPELTPVPAPLRVVQAPVDVTWRVGEDTPVSIETGVLVWSSEVLFKTGRGVAGPFYAHPMPARAWAISTGLTYPEGEVFGLQIVTSIVARSEAHALITGGEAAYKRTQRFLVPPVFTAAIDAFALPGHVLHLD